MTTDMPFSADKEKPKMPTKESQWGKFVTPGMLAVMMGGGVPYISTLETKLSETRESNARLEERFKHISSDVEAIKSTLEKIRERLEARGIVHRTDTVIGDVAGEKHTSK